MERGKQTTSKRERLAAFSGIVILSLLISENATHKHLRLFQNKT